MSSNSSIKHNIYILFAVISLLLMQGCSEQSMTDLQQFIQEVKQRPPKGIPPLEEIKSYQSHYYIAGSRRSPFRPDYEEATLDTKVAKKGDGPSPDFNRNRESLEQFPLDTLRYVGSLEQNGQLWAIVISPDQLVHRVQKGNYAGKNFGKITEITETKIYISELISDGNSGWEQRDAGLGLIE